MRKTLKNVFTLLILVATSVVTVATSKKGDYDASYQVTPDSLARKDYYVASNCPQAIQQDRVTIDNELIAYPTSRTFYNYGIPAYNLNLTYTHQVSAPMNNGVERTCVRSAQTYSGVPLIVYTCYEYNRVVCQTSFEAVQ